MLTNSNEYLNIIESIKSEIKSAQYKAALNVNRELIMLYYNIGKIINEHKAWGNKFIDNLAADIRIEFPNVKGYSVRNLRYMAKFAETYPDEQFVQQVVAQIPWSHNTLILDKIHSPEQREWYILKTAENGWSHSVLTHQIESDLYTRQVLTNKVSNLNISLIPAKLEDLNSILQMQVEAFAELLEKYQDYDTSPANEKYEDILFRFNQPETTYYFIAADDQKVGVIRVVDLKDNKTRKRISPIFIMPKFRNKGYAQQAIKEAESIHGSTNWKLDTILQEQGNCHLYEKLGYHRTGKTDVINDKLTLVFYEKD